MNSALEGTDPIALFAEWYGEAATCGLKEPTAVTLATADGKGRPTARMVLLKGHDERGFVFYTNTESRKGDDLRENPFAALCFYWPSLDRQLRVEGAVEPVSEEEADAYFASRDRPARIGAWASAQSRPLEGRFVLEKEIARFAAKYAVGAVPRPPYWSGFRINPERIEFWSQGAFRLHDRRVFIRQGDGWSTMRLFP
ncbi:MAG: pyridoxamine 5'-phosphate oxidase [Proteobacteria bacterium]|nr:pyridoxamine 5'-phosphate oxidase [Pseudomonadota bacterium]